MKKSKQWLILLLVLSLAVIGCGEQATSADESAGTFDGNSASDNRSAGGGVTSGESVGAGGSTGSYGPADNSAQAGAEYDSAQEEPVDPEGPDPEPQGPQWIQLSTDDSTSMASAQIYKGLGYYGYFGLKIHEFLNYYDPPIALFNGEEFPRTKDVDETIRFGLKAAYEVLPAQDVEDGQPEDPDTATDETPAADESPEGAEPSTDESPIETSPVFESVVGELELLFQMQADAIEPSVRRPWNLFLCVDVSGSMEGEKMAFTIDALLKMLDHLKEGDTISLTTFNDQANHVFTNLEFSANRATIETGIRGLSAGGGTNMSAGLSLSYEAAQTHYDRNKLQRVLLFGDGAANVGDTEIETFSQLTRINGQEGIYLSGIGVGTGYDFERMDALTDAGKGAHIFLPNEEEVDIIFGDYFHKVVEVAADQIAIEVVVPEGVRLSGFSGEEVSFDPNQRLQNIILASGDDITFTAKFDVVDEAALDEAFTLKVTLRPLSTGEEVVRKIEVDSLRSLISEPGRLFKRTRLIHRFGKFAAANNGDKEALISDLQAYENPDWGIREILQLLERF